MKTILIRNVFFKERHVDILISGNRFSHISPAGEVSYEADEVIDGEGYAIVPPFYNMHTHAAMTLLRGYADDMPLKTWLEDYIWPYEATLTPDDIRKGTEIAIREMIKSGTVFFSDMYFEIPETIDVVNRMGVRAAIGVTFMDNHAKAVRNEKTRFIEEWKDPSGGRICLTAAPHAIYTVSAEGLKYSFGLARKHGLKIHMHLSETLGEVEQCIKEHGMRPVHYLDSLGLLGPDVILAHCVHVDDSEIAVLAKHDVTVVHCPCSNMKLGSGIFPYRKMIQAGVRVTLGTDGASSNNNLDMGEEMKFAALLSKTLGDVECLPADMAFKWATRNGAMGFGNDGGIIEEGRLADCLLIDTSEERMQPLHHFMANWVYSADSSCIDTVICDGRILMRGRKLLV